MNAKSLAIMLFCNCAWAFNTIVSKWAVDDLAVPPLFYTVLRSVLVAIVLIPFLRRIPPDPVRVMLVGLSISGGSFALLYIGLQTASPSAAGIVSLAGAPLTVIFAVFILGEKVRWRRAIGIALAFAGVAIAIGSPSGGESGIGLLFIVLSVLVGAIGSVFFKKITIGSVELQAWAALISLIVVAPLSFGMETGQVAAVRAEPLLVGLCVLFAGLVVSVVAHSAYFRLLQQHDANLLVPLTLINPLLTIALGAWLTGDPIGWTLLLGAAIAMAGVAIILIRPSGTIFKPLLVRPRL